MNAIAKSSLPVELAWSLRRAGFELTTAKAIELARALSLVGLEHEEAVREVTRAVCVTTREENRRFDEAFDRFFRPRARPLSFAEEMRRLGFSEDDIDAARRAILNVAEGDETAFSAVTSRGADYDRLLWLVGETGKEMRRLGQLGQAQENANQRVGLVKADVAMMEVERRFHALFGERAGELLDLVRAQLAKAKAEVRAHLRQRFEERTAPKGEPTLSERSFSSLDEREIEEVRRVVRRFGEQLRGRELVRRKHEKHGRLDGARTLRAAMRTGGVPFVLHRRRARRHRPRLVLLCDISDSVRSAATFMLEFVAVAHDLFEEARSFVFVSELAETTALFRDEPISRALARAASGEFVPVGDNSNYGRAFRQFLERFGRTVDRRTTLVILGDARTNYSDPAVELLGEIRARVAHVVWLCPEKKEQWGAGDSAILQYQPRCSRVIEAANVSELEAALRWIGALRSRR